MKNQIELMRSVRKELPPRGRVHTTKKGKRGYDRRDSKRIAKESY
jgi:hypothetical protein